MTGKEVFNYIALSIVLLLAQVLICNHIVLFNLAMPIVFIYVIIRLPVNLGMSMLYTVAFTSGVLVDLFSDTMGVNALACTLLGALKRPVLFAYVPRDDKTKTMTPTISQLGLAPYCKYLLTMVTVYCLMVFSIEFFNFADIKDVLFMSAGSSAFSFLILLSIDSLSIPAKKTM